MQRMYTYMHDFSPFYTPFDVGMFGLILPLIIVLVLVTIILKGFALWHAARAGQKYWFIALLVINTFGILEIIYLFVITGAKLSDFTKTGNGNHSHS